MRARASTVWRRSSQSEFGLEPLSGHLFAFINRRGHIAQLLFWDRSGFILLKKRLEAGTFRLARKPRGRATHVQIDSAELALMLEGIELEGAKRRKRYRHDEPEKLTIAFSVHAPTIVSILVA